MNHQDGHLPQGIMAEVRVKIPARTEVRFAEFDHGGTGRYDLVVHEVDGTTTRVVASISKGQAESAMKAINDALGRWIARVEEGSG